MDVISPSAEFSACESGQWQKAFAVDVISSSFLAECLFGHHGPLHLFGGTPPLEAAAELPGAVHLLKVSSSGRSFAQCRAYHACLQW